MPKIHLTQFIQAPIERVFDLNRNLTLRKKGLQQKGAPFLFSSSKGLVDAGETITLRAKHLGKTREMTARITALNAPHQFVEEQVRGDLKSYRHEYHFKPTENGTILIDVLEYEGPRDLLGSLAAPFFLKSILTNMLKQKNELVRQYAESEKWRAVLE
jgi:ligand-binding SRPBCC domain-containing protein